uniref:Uncharacterized protein n=1 Tax=Ditylenchus dipsaci TaxID=166011 RepID=A0A915DI68_9BILA
MLSSESILKWTRLFSKKIRQADAMYLKLYTDEVEAFRARFETVPKRSEMKPCVKLIRRRDPSALLSRRRAGSSRGARQFGQRYVLLPCCL